MIDSSPSHVEQTEKRIEASFVRNSSHRSGPDACAAADRRIYREAEGTRGGGGREACPQTVQVIYGRKAACVTRVAPAEAVIVREDSAVAVHS